MSEPKLLTSKHGSTIQAFPLTAASKCNLTTGVVSTSLIHCVDDGVIAVTFPDSETPVNLDMHSGDDYAFPGTVSISITAGTYHIV